MRTRSTNSSPVSSPSAPLSVSSWSRSTAGAPIHAHERAKGRGVLLVPLRALVHHLLDVDASRFILVHNHPSGTPPQRPRPPDHRAFTGSLRALDLTLVDHVVIAQVRFCALQRSRHAALGFDSLARTGRVVAILTVEVEALIGRWLQGV